MWEVEAALAGDGQGNGGGRVDGFGNHCGNGRRGGIDFDNDGRGEADGGWMKRDGSFVGSGYGSGISRMGCGVAYENFMPSCIED